MLTSSMKILSDDDPSELENSEEGRAWFANPVLEDPPDND